MSCMSCLYILEINPLLVASFANIFSHSVGYLFILFMIYFAVQKLYWVPFVNFCFYLHYSRRYSCLENPTDGGAWWAEVHGVAKSRAWLSDFTFTFHFHALEKEMATHSSVLAWRIPGTGEPGGLPSMGSHRVGHDWSDLAAAAGDGSKKILLWFMSKSVLPMFSPRNFIVSPVLHLGF